MQATNAPATPTLADFLPPPTAQTPSLTQAPSKNATRKKTKKATQGALPAQKLAEEKEPKKINVTEAPEDSKSASVFSATLPGCTNVKSAEELVNNTLKHEEELAQKDREIEELKMQLEKQKEAKIQVIALYHAFVKLTPNESVEALVEPSDVSKTIDNCLEHLSALKLTLGVPETEELKKKESKSKNILSSLKNLSEKTGGLEGSLKPLIEKVENNSQQYLEEFKSLKTDLSFVISTMKELKPSFLAFFEKLHKKVMIDESHDSNISDKKIQMVAYCSKETTSSEIGQDLEKYKARYLKRYNTLEDLIVRWLDIERKLNVIATTIHSNTLAYKDGAFNKDMEEMIGILQGECTFDLDKIEISKLKQNIVSSILNHEVLDLEAFVENSARIRRATRAMASRSAGKSIEIMQAQYQTIKVSLKELLRRRTLLLPFVNESQEQLGKLVLEWETEAAVSETDLKRSAKALREDYKEYLKIYEINSELNSERNQHKSRLDNLINAYNDTLPNAARECNRLYDAVQRQGEFISETRYNLHGYTDPEIIEWVAAAQKVKPKDSPSEKRKGE